MKDIISALFRRCDLGEVRGEVLPVSGGLMHKMYKVQTDKGIYAIKCLNSEIMKRPGVFDNFARAEALERILENNGVQIVPAIAFSGKKMIEVKGRYFYIFKWLEGHITDSDNISKDQCLKVGEILGRIHAIDAHETKLSKSEYFKIDFKGYLKKAREKESHILTILEENMDLLEYAQTKLNDARKKLPFIEAISNDDMDPKNIMWNKGEPFVIDLECLGYSNPIASCLNLSLQWAGTLNEKYNKQNLLAFYKGYLKTYDNGFRAYGELFGIAYTWVEWLEYNLKRALEDSIDENVKLGEAEAINTIGIIKYLHSLEKEICFALNELTAPNIKN